jgi:hypothetical protein
MAVIKDKYKHKSFKSYDGDETGNIFASQIGGDVLKGAVNSTGHEHIAGGGVNVAGIKTHYPEVRYWISIKAMHGADSSVMAETANGDNLSLNGSYASTGSTKNIDLQTDDMINGIFTKIRICDGITYILAQRG